MLTLALLVSAVFELCMRWARSTLLGTSAASAAIQNHHTFLDRVARANPRKFSRQSGASYLDRYAAIARLRDHFSGQNQTLATDLPFTAIFVVMVGLIGGWLFLVPVAGFLAIVFFAKLMKRAQSEIFDVRKSIDQRRYTFLAEVLGNMQTVKANTMERQMSRRFELLQQQTVKNSHKLIIFSGFAQNYGAVFSQFMVAAMGLFGAFFVIGGSIGIAELAACMMLNGRIIQPLMKLMTLWVQSESVSMSKDKLAEIEGLEARHMALVARPSLTGRIEMRDITLANTDGVPVAEGVNAHLEPGEAALLDAKDRRATSELFDVLMGDTVPATGTAMLDGYLAQDRLSDRGRRGIARLETKPALFSGTLLENISAFGSGAQVERAVEIAARLGLERRVNRLPLGYNTRLNAGGFFEKDPINRQLIALVRIFALEPAIVLLNEPTAVLETADREALAAFLRARPSNLTLLFTSPDPRMKSLASQTVTLPRPATAEAFLADAARDRAELTLRTSA